MQKKKEKGFAGSAARDEGGSEEAGASESEQEADAVSRKVPWIS